MNDIEKNADRFTGFADVYDSARPAMPLFPVKIIEKYLGGVPQTVVDLGCGTGLSSLVWRENCKNCIGIEPSGDMLAEALKKSNETLHFQKGFGQATGLADECADAVVCSQSFHWMKPATTLKEINRILKKGGVFATVDCDWPPVCNLQAELAYSRMYETVKQFEAEISEVRSSFVRYPKEKHLENIQSSKYFRYSREIVFANRETCTAQRMFNLLMSQGSTQAILKQRPDLLKDVVLEFEKELDSIFKTAEFDIEFCYRMRIGVK